MKHVKWLNEDLEWLKKNSFNYTLLDLSLKFNKSQENISAVLRKHRLTYASRHHKQIYKFDEKFFDVIDSKEKAWLLGLFVSDGNIKTGPRNYILRWKLKDLQLIETIKSIFPTTNDIKIYYNKGNDCKYYNIEYGSKYLVSALQKLGYSNQKTYDCKYPEIPQKFDYHFIRGVMDGDGSVGIYNKRLHLSFYGNRDLIQTIKNKLSITSTLYNDNRIVTMDFVTLKIYGEKALDCLKQIYNDSEGIRLERKFNIFNLYNL